MSSSSTCFHSDIILFYKYFSTSIHEKLSKDNEAADSILKFIENLCHKFSLRGRLIFASEGINGTLSGLDKECLMRFVSNMEQFSFMDVKLFCDIDWKWSQATSQTLVFPDLYVAKSKEIVSSGNAINLEELSKFKGKHLSPHEFHSIIGAKDNKKEIVLIDVRNTFEHAIGHFETPSGGKAIDPSMVTFSTFDSSFCAKNASTLQDKKVLMYCTGGIRYVKQNDCFY